MSKPDETHRMGKRCQKKNYRLPGAYHITINVAERQWHPLGQVVGNLDQPDGDANAPRVELTAIGKMVEEELTKSITTHYPMIEVQDYVVMPEHLHFILVVHNSIISRNGRETHLGQVIAGFKKGCNRRYWAMTGQDAAAGAAQAVNSSGEPLNTVSGSASRVAGSASRVSGSTSRVSGGSPAREGKRTPSSGTTGRRPLFAYGYCDVQPITPEQLDTQRAYIKANPRSRLLRSRQRATLTACRNGFTTALTPSALRGFLLRECLQKHATAEALDAIKCRLLLADGKIALDTYGNRQLLNSKLLPVVCHRKDKSLFEQQKARCMEEAGNGAIMVSARISAGEQEIMNEMVNHGFPVIIIADNGFPERYHPSAVRLDLCATDRLLLVTPWQYQYRGKNEQVTIPFCKAMNCVAQALCRQKDDWWKNRE